MTGPNHGRRPAPKSGWQRAAPVLVVAACVVGAIVFGIVTNLGNSDDGGDPLPIAADARSIAADLADATQQQDICYGWDVSLDDQWSGHSGESRGSNQGAGKALDTARCERWVVLNGSVTWTSDSSESNDSGGLTLDAADTLGGKVPDSDDLAAVGVTDDALVDDPGGVIETAMEALPLLMSEQGAASPLPPAGDDASAAAGVSAPAAAGNDRIRAHTFALVAGIVGVLGALGLLTGGILSWRRTRRRHRPAQQRPAEARRSSAPPPVAGVRPAAGHADAPPAPPAHPPAGPATTRDDPAPPPPARPASDGRVSDEPAVGPPGAARTSADRAPDGPAGREPAPPADRTDHEPPPADRPGPAGPPPAQDPWATPPPGQSP